MKSRLLVSLMVIAMAAALIGGATMAWFTDEATSPEQTFTAGTLLIDLEQEDFASNTVNLDILNPGDEFKFEYEVINDGTKRFIYKVVFCWQDILGRTLSDFGDRSTFGTEPLSDVLIFTIKDGSGAILTSGTLENETSPLAFEVGQLNPENSDNYTIEVKFPTTAGNEYQGSKMKAAFVVMAKQIHPEAEYGQFVCPLATNNDSDG
ncbi:MAG: TasA family protein [Bacillota bacterium]